MTYFKTITFIAAAVLSIHTVAQEPTAKLGKYRGWGDRDLAFNSQAQLTCDKNFYNGYCNITIINSPLLR